MRRTFSLIFVCIFALSLFLTGCTQSVDEAQYIGTIFDGQAVLRAYGEGSQAALSGAFEQLILAQKVTLEENGDFTQMYALQNQMKQVSPFSLSLLNHVQILQNNYADIYAQAQKKPPETQYCFTSLQVDLQRSSASLQCDSSNYLKALARASAMDNAAQMLLDEGTAAGMIMLSGTTTTIGQRPDKGSWAIPITHPLDASIVVGTLHLKEMCTYTMSAPLPAKENGDTTERALSVTVIAPTALEATVLSCFLYGLDVEYAYNMVSSIKGVDALLLGENGAVLATQSVETPNAYL